MLRAIASHAERMGTIHHSVETGSGRTTLLFSHLSADHVVFAVDAGQSMSQVRNSPLFNAGSTTFVEGPTQRTLARQTFPHRHQAVLIDGPHGYPFPDLEYYYLYPTIAAGGLLVIDDIQIPSIGRMFDIIRADEMFELLEIVDDNTAFLRRTGAPLIDPDSDSWWLQGYNRPYLSSTAGCASASTGSGPDARRLHASDDPKAGHEASVAMSVAIAVPSLNQKRFLGDALDSLGGTDVTVRRAVLDAGSTDGSLSIFDRGARAGAGVLAQRAG